MTEVDLRLDDFSGKSVGKCSLPDCVAMGLAVGDHVVLPDIPGWWVVIFRLVQPQSPGFFSPKFDVLLTLVVRPVSRRP